MSTQSSPNEPWRYRCPDCGSVCVKSLTGKNRKAGKRYEANGRGRAAAQRDKSKPFRCRSCGERKDTILDMKTGQEVRSK